MKTYTIELEDTISEFIEEVSVMLNKPAEVLIQDAVFNQCDTARENLSAAFTVRDE